MELEISKIIDDLTNGNTHPLTAKHDLIKLLNENAIDFMKWYRDYSKHCDVAEKIYNEYLKTK